MENLADSGKDLKKVHEDAVGPKLRGELRLLVTMLLKAAKDIQFYPENSPVIQVSLDRAVEAVRKVSGSTNKLVFEIRQHQFLVHNTPLIDEEGPERDFAEQLFGLGVRLMEIEGVPEPEEVKSFITATLDAHRLGAEFEELAGELRKKGVSSIRLLPSGNLSARELIDVSGQSDTDERGIWTSEESDEGEFDRVTELLDEYDECLHSPVDGAQKALDYVRETDCLATVSGELDGRMDDESARPVCGQLFHLLAETSEVVHDERPSLRHSLLDEVSRVVDDMDVVMRTTFVHGHLMVKTGPRASAVALLNRLNDDILSDLLAESLVVHGGAEAAIQTYFMTVPVPEERQAGIVTQACKKAKDTRPDDSAMESLLARTTKTETGPAEKPEAAASHTAETFEAIDPSVVGKLEISPEEQAEVEKSAQTALDFSVQHNAATMVALLGNLADPEHLTHVLNGLEALRIRLLSSLDGLVQATDIVEAYLKKRQASGEAQQASALTEALDAAIDKAGGEPSIHALLDLTGQCEGSDKNYETILRYLRMLGEPAYRTLVDSLRKEDVRSRRMAARRLVVSLGEVCVDLLARDIGREDWFVVRNVVSILGDIRSDKGIMYLAQALIHADKRVRRETINGLGKIGTAQAARTLKDALKPDDLETAHAAVRWLGLIANTDSVTGLTRLMDELGNSAEARQVKVSIVDSLTQIGSPMALACLERVKEERKLFFFKKDSVLAAAAARAIETIEARVDGKETPRADEKK